jgi:type VI secretion system secreted protein Hcp
MGMNAFLDIPGIKGSARQKHALDKIVVAGVTAEVKAELNWKTGRPEPDKNKHKPMVITKDIDLASPALQTALENGTVFGSVKLEFWRMPPGGGTEQNYYTIDLRDVQVVGIGLLMDNNRLQKNGQMPEQEQVSLSYTKVRYTFAAGGKQGQGGTDPVEEANTGTLAAECDIPVEAKIKAVAVDAGKEAGKLIAGQVYGLFKAGGEGKK